jgi:phage terminase small subunit
MPKALNLKPKKTNGRTKLTGRQRRFVEEYLLDPTNATKAARIAGYKTPVVQASQCLRIRDRMEEMQPYSRRL